MLNIIKMDLYRMLKTKSMYVIWIVLAKNIIDYNIFMQDRL